MRLMSLLIASAITATPNRESTTEPDGVLTTPFTTMSTSPNATGASSSSNETMTTPFPVVTEIPIDNGFDMGSFFGGVVLTVGVTGTAYFGMKFYKANHPDYRHI